MKILIVTGRFHGTGGTETFVRSICEDFIKKGHEVTVISHQRFSERKPTQKTKSFGIYYTFPSFHVPRIPMSYLPSYVLAKWLKILRLSRNKYDIVNCQGELEGFCALRAKPLLRCPVTLRVAGLWNLVALKETREVYGDGFLPKIMGGLMELMEREVLKDSDAISTLNEQQKEIMVNKHDVRPGKIRVIPHGVDTAKFSPTTTSQFRDEMRARFNLDGPVILFVGRLTPVKRIDLLIRAVGILVRDIPSVKLALIGPPSYRNIDYYRDQARLLGVEKNLLYVGETSHLEMPKYMAMGDVCADVSEEYGIGFSTLEAMSCGLPVVCTRPKDGVLKVNYSPENIAEGLRTILTDETKARILGQRARKHIEKTHGFDKMIDEYIKFFNEAIR